MRLYILLLFGPDILTREIAKASTSTIQESSSLGTVSGSIGVEFSLKELMLLMDPTSIMSVSCREVKVLQVCSFELNAKESNDGVV
ncbi:hypothetical protein Tco_0068724 [Tanacetum coccineum]